MGVKLRAENYFCLVFEFLHSLIMQGGDSMLEYIMVEVSTPDEYQALCTTLTTICPELRLTQQPQHKQWPDASERLISSTYSTNCVRTAKVNRQEEEPRTRSESALLFSRRLQSLFIK